MVDFFIMNAKIKRKKKVREKMASYITHTQMALETYEKLKQEKILKTEINQKLMTTFAHGIDLSNYN